MKLFYLLIILTFFLKGCFSSYPLNLSKEEYSQLNLQDKLKVKERQAKLDNQLRIQKVQKKREENKYAHELALIEKEKVERLYNKSDEKLYVSISNGSIKYLKKGYFIKPFEIVPYEVKRLNIYAKNSTRIHHNLWVSFQPEGFYIGLYPPKQLQHLKSFITANIDELITNSYYQPFVIPRSQRWYLDKKYKLSFKHQYEAKNITVILYLKESRKRRFN